jgi:hypothetical protein
MRKQNARYKSLLLKANSLSVVRHICNPSTPDMRQEDNKFKASLTTL